MIETPSLINEGVDTSGAAQVTTTAPGAISANQTLFIASGFRVNDADLATINASDDINGAYTSVVQGVGAPAARLERGALHLYSDNAALSLNDAFEAVEVDGVSPVSSALSVFSVGGLDVDNPIDDFASDGGFGDDPDSGSITPSAGNHLVVGLVAVRASAINVNPDSIINNVISEQVADAGFGSESTTLHVASYIGSFDGATPISFTPDWADQGNATYAVMIASLNAANVAGVPTTVIINWIGP